MRAPYRTGTADDRAKRKARIIELHESGCTVDAIAERLGITKSRVGHLLKEQGLTRNAWDGSEP